MHRAFPLAPLLTRVVPISAAHEVAPRLAYLEFLRASEWGWTAGEPLASFVARQPFVLERSFAVAHQCAGFLALNKPWDTRHDVPRGWPGKVSAIR
jgi:hypothetical protein